MADSKNTCNIMKKWDLTVHVEFKGKIYKTKAMFFPFVTAIAKWRTFSINSITKEHKHFCTYMLLKQNKVSKLEDTCDRAAETRDVIVNEDGGHFSFKKICT